MPSKINQSSVLAMIVGLWIFLIPSNLFFKLGENQAYVHGLLSDYLLIKIYLHDFLSIILLWLCWRPKISKPHSGWLAIIYLGVRQLWTARPATALWFMLRGVGAYFLATSLQKEDLRKHQPVIFGALFTTIIFQTGLALYQFGYQRSLAGYYLLGEPNLQRSFGIARGVFGGAELVLPYGTTAHPNLLAGVVVVYTWLLGLLYSKTKHKSFGHHLGLAVSFLASLATIAVTQSWAAGCTLLLASIVLALNQTRRLTPTVVNGMVICLVSAILIVPVTLNWAATQQPEQLSITRRAVLNQAAFNAWRSQPLFGLGLHQFTAALEDFYPTAEVVRFVQPVHHLGLLMLSELGLIGLVLLYIATRTRNRHSQIAVLAFVLMPIITTDHYLMTLATGQLLLVLSFWLSSLLSIE